MPDKDNVEDKTLGAQIAASNTKGSLGQSSIITNLLKDVAKMGIITALGITAGPIGIAAGIGISAGVEILSNLAKKTQQLLQVRDASETTNNTLKQRSP